jgi:tetratricopeptide (TPR) repeat protein
MSGLNKSMRSDICDSPRLETMVSDLAERLKTTTGKKQYGYLPKSLKGKVDEIVDELARLPEVAACYDEWNRLRDEVESYYKDKPREHLPLSQQKEFRAIKNAVVKEAVRLAVGQHTFEDAGMKDEAGDDAPHSVYAQAKAYRAAKDTLYDLSSTPAQHEAALLSLQTVCQQNYSPAAYLLGKVYCDGVAVPPNPTQAEYWFTLAARAGNAFAAYALGKLLLGQQRHEEAIGWLNQAADKGSHYAQYTLGKVYLLGEAAEKDVELALGYLESSANRGNQFAQYTLGKLYLLGKGVARDREQAVYWLTQSAAQGNQYAQFFLDRIDQFRPPAPILAVTRLLHHLGRIFRDNSLPPANPSGPRIDSKRRQQLMERRQATGQRMEDTMQSHI